MVFHNIVVTIRLVGATDGALRNCTNVSIEEIFSKGRALLPFIAVFPHSSGCGFIKEICFRSYQSLRHTESFLI